MLTERESRVVSKRVGTPQIVRAVLIRNRTQLVVLASLFVISALTIYWLSLHIVTKTTTPLQTYENPQYLLYFRLLVFSLPFLVGVLGGTPLLAKEYESGTFRFTQTQGVGRRRLLLITLASYLVLLVIGSTVAGFSIGQFYSADNLVRPMPQWAIGGFFSQPLLFLAMVVACFCVGVFLGAAVRRTVAGITVAVATFSIGALIIYTELFQRSLAFVSSSVMTAFDSVGSRHSFRIAYWVENGHGVQVSSILSPAQFQVLHLTRHYTFWLQFVPASHYDSVQLLWLAIFLLIAVITIVATFARLGGKDGLLAHPRLAGKSSSAGETRSSLFSTARGTSKSSS